ncbi:MAG: DEAD/DEAH box helicase, partial [Acidobacteria bacterium]|nr:DEAD/DEAH box helicase [Acidobacteriota bacterium]
EVLEAVLDMLSGRYPSDEFSELRPRIVWDRVAGVLSGRSGAQRLAVTNAGTIPDRGLFGVFLPDGTRVGELDEEMVYESRPGETFLLGASSWRIEDITFDRVVVTPAPGQPGKMPFWHGDGPGRPIELGKALGAFIRETRMDPSTERLVADFHLDDLAATNLLGYLADQAEATGVVPDDRTIVLERFRDEIGDWRVCIHTPFGAQVHAPWAMALRARLEQQWGVDPEMIWSDDGIVLRLPETMDDVDSDVLVFDPDEIERLVVDQLGKSAMFASRFRECAGRALLLPRRRPGQRTPLWQQRQRAADLLTVASKYPGFPLLLETTRECLNDVFDLPALRSIMADIARREIKLVSIETDHASPFAQSLLFSWIAIYMYEGDAPLAERRAAALSLDRDLLRDLLGAEELRELIDADVLAELELALARIGDRFVPRDPDELHDLLRIVGPLTLAEIATRAPGTDLDSWLGDLRAQSRVIEVSLGGSSRFAVAEDAGRLRDALGVAIPVGLPAAFTDPVDRPLDELVARYARTHGPFRSVQAAEELAVDPSRVSESLRRLLDARRIVEGEFRPDGVHREFCDVEVLAQLRRRSLAALRAEIEPTDTAAIARMLPGWQGVGSQRRGEDGILDVVSVLAGAPIPASILERDVLASRIDGYRVGDLDAVCASGEVVWVGAGPIGSRDGRVCLAFRDTAAALLPIADEIPDDPHHRAILQVLSERGATFWPELTQAVAQAELLYDDETVSAALWDLVWAGVVTNDSFGAVRAYVAARTRSAGRSRRSRRGVLRRGGPASSVGRWSLVAPLMQPECSATERSHAKAMQLLERYGVLTRQAALGEGTTGGFAGVYPVLKMLEDQGTVRRGYFVSGLGAAQFALPGAVDRLRSARAEDDTQQEPERLILAAADPAQTYGATLRWPSSKGRPSRSAGAYVLLRNGLPVLFVEKGGRSLITFANTDVGPDDVALLKTIVGRHGGRKMEIVNVDGEPVTGSPVADVLRAAGFRDAYRGLRFDAE